MGGASTAAPIDASGALYWNPATISGLPGSSIDFGVELLYPQSRLASSIAGLGAGSDRGDNGVFAVPTMALVYMPDDSAFTYGLGVLTVGGFGVNYRADQTNPILSPQPPNGVGLGSLYSNLQVLELTPTMAVQVTDRLSISGGPTLALAHLEADPLFLAPPNADGTYPAATHTRMSWGGGFQVGAFYKLDGGWNLGVSYKSTQWLEGFHWQSAGANGIPRDISYRFNVPSLVSVGVGYTGIDIDGRLPLCRLRPYRRLPAAGLRAERHGAGPRPPQHLRHVPRGAVPDDRRPVDAHGLLLQPGPGLGRPDELQRRVTGHPGARPVPRGVVQGHGGVLAVAGVPAWLPELDRRPFLPSVHPFAASRITCQGPGPKLAGLENPAKHTINPPAPAPCPLA